MYFLLCLAFIFLYHGLYWENKAREIMRIVFRGVSSQLQSVICAVLAHYAALGDTGVRGLLCGQGGALSLILAAATTDPQLVMAPAAFRACRLFCTGVFVRTKSEQVKT